jgi:rubredoxin
MPTARNTTEQHPEQLKEHKMKVWQCIVCGFIYNEADGDPEHGIAPGTAWADVPADWSCPDCGVGKEDFEMVEV